MMDDWPGPVTSHPGYVYLIVSEDQGFGKIGWSREDPLLRLMKMQTANPAKLTLGGSIVASRAVEGIIHQELAAYQHAGEWFRNTYMLRTVFAAMEEDSVNADDELCELPAEKAAASIRSGLEDYLHGPP